MTHKVKVATAVPGTKEKLVERVKVLGGLLNSGFSHPNFDISEETDLRNRFVAEKRLLSRTVDVAWSELTIYTTYVFADADAAKEYLNHPVILGKIVLMNGAGITVEIVEGSV